MSAAIMLLCFDISTENNQIALIITQPIWNSHFLTLIFIFFAAIFFDKRWTKDIFVDTPTVVSKSSFILNHRLRGSAALL